MAYTALVSYNIFEKSNTRTTFTHACNTKRQVSQPYGQGTEIRKLQIAVQRIPRIFNTMYSATLYINMWNFARFSSLLSGGWCKYCSLCIWSTYLPLDELFETFLAEHIYHLLYLMFVYLWMQYLRTTIIYGNPFYRTIQNYNLEAPWVKYEEKSANTLFQRYRIKKYCLCNFVLNFKNENIWFSHIVSRL